MCSLQLIFLCILMSALVVKLFMQLQCVHVLMLSCNMINSDSVREHMVQTVVLLDQVDLQARRVLVLLKQWIESCRDDLRRPK